MIRVYARGTYNPSLKKERGFYYFCLFTDGRPVQRYTESGPCECQSAFESELYAIFQGLEWAGKNYLPIETIEVYCSPSVALCLGPQTAKYFQPKSEADMRAIMDIAHMRAMAPRQVSYYARPSQDDSDLMTGNEAEQGLH